MDKYSLLKYEIYHH